jgi:hypothetical protein
MVALSWKCPACQTAIRHEGDEPRPRRVYRCHVCRLELVLDEKAQTMIVAPLDDPPPAKPTRRR